MIRHLTLLAGLLALQGCGVALMQTARPTAHKHLQATVGSGLLYNSMVDERGLAPGNLPQHLALRYGSGQNSDVGLSLFMGSGALVDGKWNLLPADNPTALSIDAGFGGAYNLGFQSNGGVMLHLPTRLLISHTLPGGLTPYGGLGYGALWVLGYNDVSHPSWHGDGMLLANAGVEIPLGEPVHLLVEYDLWQPVLNAKKDDHAFACNHVFSLGLRF